MTLTLEPTTTPTLEGVPVLHERGSRHPDALDAVERVLFDCAWLWTLIDSPPDVGLEAPSTARRLRDIVTWTEWSNRHLAEVLGTTHPTIAAVLSGRDTVRVHNLRDRIARMHSVVERLALLSDRDIPEVRRLLETHLEDGASAADLMKRGEYSQAYITALDIRRPPVGEGLMGSGQPTRIPGSVSIESLDE